MSTKWFFETATPPMVGCKSFSSLSYSVFPLQEALKRVIKRLLWESSNRCPSYLQSTPGILGVPGKTVTRWSKICSNRKWKIDRLNIRRRFFCTKGIKEFGFKIPSYCGNWNFPIEIYAVNDWIFSLKDHGTFENVS